MKKEQILKTMISGVSAVLFVLLLFSVFKNISYPLLWNDESVTVVGTERVLEYGYPKVHGEKNVFHDFMHPDPSIAVNEHDDAFAGSSSWGHYYYGIIGYKLAEGTDDIYLKTGILRSTYAVTGLAGMLLFAFMAVRFLPGARGRHVFIALFLLLSLVSVSQALYLREVRYYSLALLLSSAIVGLYIRFRFYKPFNKIVFAVAEAVLLWLAFVTFSPLFAAALLAMGMSELCIFIGHYRKTGFVGAFRNAWPAVAFAGVAGIGVIPMMIEFKYFEISTAIAEYTGFNGEMYRDNLSALFGHFWKQELLLAAIIMKVFVLCRLRRIYRRYPALLRVSAFLTLYFLVSLFLVGRIPQTVFARYVIYLQPVLSVVLLLDLFMVAYTARKPSPATPKGHRKPAKQSGGSPAVFPATVLAILFLYAALSNLSQIQGHIYELFHPYKGPLDYTIPWIAEHYPRADTLVIAANYEEYSYMYYLKSKVVVGYVGNNLEADARETPDIIAYRKGWQNHLEVFNGYFQRARYTPVSFPVYDSPVNTIPEFNFLPAFNHRFRTVLTSDPNRMTYLYIMEH
ncbi:MAG: hypothetical protein LBS12_03995 [Prevotellaceae bacterium]|jgi:hypothetical protein|nr:hypothetical protein [Prevotellaceae bacterium]